MPKPSKMDIDELYVHMEAAHQRSKTLLRAQKFFLAICGLALASAFALKFTGGLRIIVMWLGIAGGLCGLACMIAGWMARSVSAKADALRKSLEREIKRHERQVVAKIPLSIGFANLSGEDLRVFAAADAEVLSPLFATSRSVADHQIPSAQILFVYAHLNEDGTIKGQPSAGIRQIVQLTNAAIVILASPNTAASLQRAAQLPGPKTANIVLTLDRNGSGFGRFFKELFEKMRDGTDMLSAWVQLAPQHPQANLAYAPQTVLMAEGGRIAFPK